MMNSHSLTSSCACGVVLPCCEVRATHRYIVTTPECWGMFSEVLAREYENPTLFGSVHQLTVDTYAAQHPSGQPAKSLDAHLASLCALLERGDHPNRPEALKRFIQSRTSFPELRVPGNLGPLTVADVAAASPQEHCEIVRRWARQVWSAWSDSHATIAALLNSSTGAGSDRSW
jgi:Family of unknown function (DUF5946)